MTRIANQDFTLTRDDCRPLYFVAGDAIPAEYSDHWFVRLHTDEAPDGADANGAEPDKRKPGRHAKA